MDNRKKGKTRRSYESDFKQELVRMLISGKSASELSETFGITENLLYRWKRMATMKTKTSDNKPKDEQNAKLVAENAKLKAEIDRLKNDREILKKALGLFSTSD